MRRSSGLLGSTPPNEVDAGRVLELFHFLGKVSSLVLQPIVTRFFNVCSRLWPNPKSSAACQTAQLRWLGNDSILSIPLEQRFAEKRPST